MSDSNVDEIRERMALIRARAQGKALRLEEETRRLLDWKHYVRLFPWGALAAAAAIGYFAVPRTPPAMSSRDESAAPALKPRPRRSGLLGAAAGLAADLALRAGAAALRQQLQRMMTQPASPRPAAEPLTTSTQEPKRDYLRPFAG